MRSPAVLAVTLLALVAGCRPRVPELTDQDLAELHGLFDSTLARLRAGNLEAWSQAFSFEAVFYAPNTPPLIGRPAILAWGQRLPPVESIGFSDVQIDGAGRLAFGTSAYHLKLKDLPVDSGKQLVVFLRDPDAWRVIAGSFNSDLPLPQPAAAPRR